MYKYTYTLNIHIYCTYTYVHSHSSIVNFHCQLWQLLWANNLLVRRRENEFAFPTLLRVSWIEGVDLTNALICFPDQLSIDILELKYNSNIAVLNLITFIW